MADGIEGVRLQHARQVALLQHPDPVGREHPGNVGNERTRIVEVVEHGDRRDGAGRPAAACRDVCIGGEESGADLQIGPIPRSEHLSQRIDPDAKQAGLLIGRQQRAVVAADIEHGIAAL